MGKAQKAGFTLIELSIVLVIIGLIVGGILVGQDMIQAAKIRQTGSLIEKLDTAVNTFKSKYNCLPGDCANATAFGLGTNAPGYDSNSSYYWAINGNGDGKIYSFDQYNSANAGPENFNFFQMLIDANLIADTRVCKLNPQSNGGWGACVSLYPLEAMGLAIPAPTQDYAGVSGPSAIGIINTDAINKTSTTGYRLPFSHMYLFGLWSTDSISVFSASVAFELDSKFDDGLPASGSITTLTPWGTNVVYDRRGTCINTTPTPNVYNANDLSSCALTWRAGF